MGSTHACAIVSGEVYCWGDNVTRKLGDGTSNTSLVPTKVCAPGATATCDGSGESLTGIVSVAAGMNHTCAVETSGKVYCWGQAAYGGLGFVASGYVDPTQVPGIDRAVA